MKSRSVRAGLLMAAVAMAVGYGVQEVARGVTYTYTAPVGTNTTWSGATWTNGTPVEASDATLQFFVTNTGTANTVTANFTASNDLGGTAFDLQSLVLTGTSPTNDSAGERLVNISGNTLNFCGTANTVTISSANGLAYNVTSNVTISNGLTINGTSTVYTQKTWQYNKISGAMSGTGGVTKNDSGKFRLAGVLSFSGGLTMNAGQVFVDSNSNTYTGGTTLNGGALIVSQDKGLANGTLTLNGGTLHPSSSSGPRTLSNPIQVGGNVQINDTNIGGTTTVLSGAVNLLGGMRTIAVDTGTNKTNVTFSGAVSNGGLVKSGPGTLYLTTTNTYTGGTIINAGNLQFNTASSVPASGLIMINSTGALNGVGAYTSVANWLNSGKISTDSTGSIALTGANSESIDFTGYNKLMLGSASTNSVFTGTITPANNTYRLGGGGNTLKLPNANTLTGAYDLVVGASGATGTVLLSNTNDMSGATTVNSGTFNLTSNIGALPNSAAVINNSTLSIDATGAAEATNVTRVKSLALENGTVTVTGTTVDTTDAITSALTLNSGFSKITLAPSATTVTKLTAQSMTQGTGLGMAFVNGVNLGKDDSSTGNVGRIILTNAPTLVGTTDAVGTGINATNKDTKIVPFLVGESGTAAGYTGTATGTPNTFVTFNAGTGLRPLNIIDEFSNTISTGNNVRLTSAATMSAVTGINSLIVGSNLTANSTLSVASGAILFPASTSISGSGVVDFGAMPALVTVNNNMTGTFATKVTGSGGLVKSGSGTLSLAAINNTFTGVTTINGGTVSVNNLLNGDVACSLGMASSDPANIVLNGGQLTVNSSTNQTTDRGMTLTNMGGTLNIANSTVNVFIGGAIMGTGSLTKDGNGILTLGTANSYTGNTTLTKGTLKLGNSQALGTTTASLIVNGGSLDLNGNSITVGSFSGSGGNVSNTAGTVGSLTVNTTGATLYSGSILNNVSLTKSGSGTLILNSLSSTYSGGTNMNEGMLVINNNANLGTGPLNFNGGTIQYISSSTGALDLSGRTITLGGAAKIDTTSVAVTFANGIGNGGTGSLTKLGTGTLVLAGSNNYSGGTTVSSGTLVAAHANALGSGPVAVSTGSTLQVQKDAKIAVFMPVPTLTGTGKVDVTNNALIVQSTSENFANDFATLNTMVKNARNGGATTWMGNGISSSLADHVAFSGKDVKGVAIASNAVLGLTKFGGQDVNSNSILIKYTYVGDADLDGKITVDDYLAIDTGYLFDGSGYTSGDFNYSGTIDAADFALIDNSLLNQGSPLAESMIQLHASWFGPGYLNGISEIAMVPEPASLGVLGLGMLCLLKRRR